MIVFHLYILVNFYILFADDPPCESRTKCDSSDPTCLPLWPCGPDPECFWDMGDRTGLNNKCIDKDTDCTNKDHYYKDYKENETFVDSIDTLDQVFMIDATGSMYGSINAAYTMSRQLAENLTTLFPQFKFRFAAVMYRDPVTVREVHQIFDFSENVTKLVNFFSTVYASGGGDTPEDVAGGFDEVMKLNWSEKTGKKSLKTVTMIADAPPHGFMYSFPTEKERLQNILRKVALYNISLAVLSLNNGMDSARTFFEDTYRSAGNNEIVWYMLSASQIGEKYIKPTLENVGDTIGRYNHTCKFKPCINRTANSSTTGNWRCGVSTESEKCLQDIGGVDELKCVLTCTNPLYIGTSVVAQENGKCVLQVCSSLSSALCAANPKCRYRNGRCIDNPCYNKTREDCGNCTLVGDECTNHECVPDDGATTCPPGCDLDGNKKCVNDTCGTYTDQEACEGVTTIDCLWQTNLVLGTSRCILNKCSQLLGKPTCGANCVYHLSKNRCIPNPCEEFATPEACRETDCMWTIETETCDYHNCVRLNRGTTCPVTSTPCVKDASDKCKVDPCAEHLTETSCNETECFWKKKNGSSTSPSCEYQVCVRLQEESTCIPGCQKANSRCVPDVCQKALNDTTTCPIDCNRGEQDKTCEWQSCVRQPHVSACTGWEGRPCVLDGSGKCIEQVNCSKINNADACLLQITCEWDFIDDTCNPNHCLNCSQDTCYPIGGDSTSCRNNTCGELNESSLCVGNPVCYWDYQDRVCNLNTCNDTCNDEINNDNCKLDERGSCVPNGCNGLGQNECLKNPACMYVNDECIYNPCIIATLPNGKCLPTMPCILNPDRKVCLPENCSGDCVTTPDWCLEYKSSSDCPRECAWINDKCKADECTRFPEHNTTELPPECPLMCVFYRGRSRTFPENEADECVADPCSKYTTVEKCPGDCVWEELNKSCNVGPCTMLNGDPCALECQLGGICGGGKCAQIEDCQEIPGCKVNLNTTVGAKPCKDDECFKHKTHMACSLNELCAWIDGECESKEECTNSLKLDGDQATCRDGCFLDPFAADFICVPDPCASIDSPVQCLLSEDVFFGHACRRRNGHCRTERVCPDAYNNCPPEVCRLKKDGTCLPNPCPAYVVQELCDQFSNCSWLGGHCEWNPCAIDPTPKSPAECAELSRGCELTTKQSQCMPDSCVKQYYPGAECKGSRECIIENTSAFGTTCVYDPDKAQQSNTPKKFPWWIILVGALVVAAIVGVVGAAAVFVWKKKKDERAKIKIEDVGASEVNNRDIDAAEDQDELMQGGVSPMITTSDMTSSNSEQSKKSSRSSHSKRSSHSPNSKKSSKSSHSKRSSHSPRSKKSSHSPRSKKSSKSSHSKRSSKSSHSSNSKKRGNSASESRK